MDYQPGASQFHAVNLAANTISSGQRLRRTQRANTRNVSFVQNNPLSRASGFLKKNNLTRMKMQTDIMNGLTQGAVNNAVSLDKTQRMGQLHMGMEAAWRAANPTGTNYSLTSQGMTSKVRPPKSTSVTDENEDRDED